MRISFVGDIMCNADQVQYYEMSGAHDINSIRSVRDLFKDSCHIVANLETPISKKNEYLIEKPYVFSTNIHFLDSIKGAGIDILTTANNHCLDCGVEGLKQTIACLDEYGIDKIGTYKSQRDKHYMILDNDGVKIGIMSYTYGTNAFLNNVYLDDNQLYMVDMVQEQELKSHFSRYLYHSRSLLGRALRKLFKLLSLFQENIPVHERFANNKKELECLKRNVRECREQGVDYIIMCLHVGGQYNETPSDTTNFYIEYCKSIGIDIVIANHEHVIHPIKKEGNFLCTYSLGNFLSSTGLTSPPYDKMSEYSMSITLDINKESIEYYISLFKSRIDKDGLVYTSPLYSCICDGTDNKLTVDYQLLMNRILGTSNQEYPICKEYKIV